MNAIITSLLLRTKPDDVKMLLVDPKKVEFTPYQKIPHLIGPVINDAAQASNALKAIVKIMRSRSGLSSTIHSRSPRLILGRTNGAAAWAAITRPWGLGIRHCRRFFGWLEVIVIPISVRIFPGERGISFWHLCPFAHGFGETLKSLACFWTDLKMF